jgi:hypothetical protein
MKYGSVSITKGWKRYTCSAYVLMTCMQQFDPNDEQARDHIEFTTVNVRSHHGPRPRHRESSDSLHRPQLLTCTVSLLMLSVVMYMPPHFLRNRSVGPRL